MSFTEIPSGETGWECDHGYYRGEDCPDCDVANHLPTVVSNPFPAGFQYPGSRHINPNMGQTDAPDARRTEIVDEGTWWDGARSRRPDPRSISNRVNRGSICPGCGSNRTPVEVARGATTYHNCPDCDFSSWDKNDYGANEAPLMPQRRKHD